MLTGVMGKIHRELISEKRWINNLYTLDRDKITSQKTGNEVDLFSDDADGKVVSMFMSVNIYNIVRNAQGDIMHILDEDGERLVNYVCDSWGKIISTTGILANTIVVQNPFRYRGLYYDFETGLYYLQSKYYDPEVGRFLNADDTGIFEITQVEIFGGNLFAYCTNNSVMSINPNGYWLRLTYWGIIIGELL